MTTATCETCRAVRHLVDGAGTAKEARKLPDILTSTLDDVGTEYLEAVRAVAAAPAVPIDQRLQVVVDTKRAYEARLVSHPNDEADTVHGIITGLQMAVDLIRKGTGAVVVDPLPPRARKPKAPAATTTPAPARSSETFSVGKCARRLLDVLTMPDAPTTREELSILSGYAMSGSFDAALAELRELGWLDGLTITGAGIREAATYERPTAAALLESWCRKLDTCPGTLLRTLIAFPHGATREQLSASSGYAMSGSFDAALADLRTREFITRGSPIVAHALFRGGRAT